VSELFQRSILALLVLMLVMAVVTSLTGIGCGDECRAAHCRDKTVWTPYSCEAQP